MPSRCRNLVLILGDQLNLDSSAFDHFDADQDVVWMAEVHEESTHVKSHKARIAIFFSAMRHFHQRLKEQEVKTCYRKLDDPRNLGSFEKELKLVANEFKPQKLVLTEPGEWRVKDILIKAAQELDIPLEIREDCHFICSREEFLNHAKGRKQLRLEYFYRELRRKHGILVEGDEPVGGKWNYDNDNRGSFGKQGPEVVPLPTSYPPDAITKEVIELVERQFPDHPGSLDNFDWPVTPEQAEQMLDDFIEYRLPNFGQYQDAMWVDEPFLYHSLLSVAMNLKLIDPRVVINRSVQAYEHGNAPLNSVEGFVRQILGWREYVRAIYWNFMPEYVAKNQLDANQPLPEFYWTGKTEMNCLSQSIGQTLKYGYAHHIQRLMVTGLFSLLLGVDPKQVHEWYLAVYVDAVEWVELPNSLGMSQFADGGIMASKPYVATGKYIQRMSNYCQDCGYNPAESTGEKACPFTTLYWDFLARNKDKLKGNNRMTMQLRNLERKKSEELYQIQEQAEQHRTKLA